ncbi:MAG: site-specific DNA-methyltransferase [Rikenellaceae bacterium]
MDKLKMESLDITKCNIEKIGALFPNVLTESLDEHGKLVKVINFDKLRQELTDDIIDNGDESYDFTWVGKNQAIVDANTPIRKTLRPVVDNETIPTGSDSNGKPYCSTGSKNFDTTENLYIEGDNLDVLKLLQESYLNNIKMIYIDPPYNTGKDSFVYPDKFTADKDEYEEQIAYRNDDGKILFDQNNDSNPRFHSDWCSMIYARLKLAKNLLADDGVIFISIDDNEVENSLKICDEIFGEKNFITMFTRKGSGGRQDSKYYAIVHEYILCCAKNIDNYISGKEIKENDVYPFFDEEKQLKYKTQLLRKWGENSKRSDRPNLFYPIVDPDGNDNYPMLNDSEEGCWRWGKETMARETKNGRVEFKKKADAWVAYEKIFEPSEDNPNTKLYTSIIDDIGTSTGAPLIKTLFGDKLFDYPKPVELLKRIITLANAKDNDIILDFFSGSATTAHAVMQLNAEDGGNRKFICVQLPEVTDTKSEASKAGFETICEIGKERIRLAGEKIKAEVEENNAQLKLGEEPKKAPDIGFRVLKVDDTNMKDVYYGAEEITQTMLDEMISNIKEDRTGLDLLYGVLLDWGIPLSAQCETLTIDGVTAYNYDDGSLIACLENQKVSETAIREIAKIQPLRVVFRDSSFVNSPDKINVEEIFKLNAPNTSVKVI